MPTSLPESVRETWGEPAADDCARWLDEYVQDRAVTRDEYREILSRLDVLENEVAGINERLDRMEQRFEDRFGQIEERFNHLEERFEDRLSNMEKRFEDRFNKLEEHLDGQFDQIENRFNQMDERIDRMHEQMRVM